MQKPPNRRMLVAVSDLFFTVKILDSAKRAMMQAEMVKTQEELLEKVATSPALVVIDLNFEALEPVKMNMAIKNLPEAKGTNVLGFVSHVQADLKKEAQEAGCDMVLARSAFSQNLPHILKRYSGVI